MAARPLTSAQLCIELARFGRLLDAADARHIALSPRLYRQAAVRAKAMIRDNMADGAVQQVCEASESLTELRENLLFDIKASETALPAFDFQQALLAQK